MTCCKAVIETGDGRGRDLGLFQPFKPATELMALCRPGEAEQEEGNSLGSILGGDDADDEAAAEDWAWPSGTELWRF